MASTPLQMLLCGSGVNASADVIRAHSIAMFLPGFVTGRLIQRFGKGKRLEDGKVVPLDVEVGNRILFGKYSGSDIKLDGDEFMIMREDEVLGILESQPVVAKKAS